MESKGGALEFYITVAAAITVALIADVSGLPASEGDNVVVEVKLEKELHIISRNTTVNESDTVVQPFECVIRGLSKEELHFFSSGKNPNVIVSTLTGNLSRFHDDGSNEAGSHSEPFNVDLTVVNGTLVVKGDVLMMSSNDSHKLTGSNESLTNCEVIFLEADESIESRQESSGNFTSRESEGAPIITSEYDHIVLMNGAPEQVVSCTARSDPPPQVSWILQNCNESDAVALTRTSNRTGETISYLLFSQVEKRNTGNYTCVAENERGRATKTFEIEVISVEAINPRCNDISDEAPAPHGQEVIFNQNIHDILRRSKRHLWYQWRTTKIYVPPFNRPFDPPTNGDRHNSDLQKMVNFITERLLLADKVAVNKWDNNKPVEDAPREQIILENVVRLAENRGLNPDWAHRFFRDQIEANKDIQYELIRIWQIDGRRPPGPPVDLGNEIRPEIDYINDKLIELASYTERERRQWKCRTEVEKNARYSAFLYNLDPLHQKALQRATRSICIAHYSGGGPPFPVHPYPPNFPPF